MGDRVAVGNGTAPGLTEEGGRVVDPRFAELKDRFSQTEARLLAFLRGKASASAGPSGSDEHTLRDHDASDKDTSAANNEPAPPARKPARAIDEDDYGDDEDEDEEEETSAEGAPSSSQQRDQDGGSAGQQRQEDQDKPEVASSKELTEDGQITEEAAKNKFRDYFFTLESDRDAMLEQQKLDAMEAQIDAETTGQPPPGSANAIGGMPLESLSTTNLGATSLVMKNLFRRIDEKRNQIKATDNEIRNIIKDVRKGRSKWASDDKVNQEELYEAAEQVLNSLKAETEYAGPFLQRVNKREAPDYYQIIKHPMDIGTMFKDLRRFKYKSKKEFVDDLNLIWANCLRYNADPNHFLRKKALYMRKRSEELLQHVPDVTILDRAAFEAEERRKAKLETGLDGEEDSDDEEPIMASRGRKAPKKGTTTRKQPAAQPEGTPGAETKPPLAHASSTTALRNDFLRPDSEAPAENGFSTPPPGSLTPLGPLGIPGSAAPGSQADASEMDIAGDDSTNGQAEDMDIDDPDLKLWKQATKKGRARIATSRHRLFYQDKLNPEEVALLRSKAGMRRWLRHQMEPTDPNATGDNDADGTDGPQGITGETIAEGLEEEEEGYLPDYYDSLAAIPDLEERLKWVDDSEGQAIVHGEETLRLLPKGSFVSPESNLTKKMEANMVQMQETRKICAKIGIVKQMQLQSQMYQNQFQKYNPLPLNELDIEPHVVSDDGPMMAPWVCRTALQRSVAKIFYHAGFEEFQPSALEAVTDITADFFERLVTGLSSYREEPRLYDKQASTDAGHAVWRPRFTKEESVLHALHSNGIEMDHLEGYVRDDVDRLGSKLGVMHDRMKAHLAELLRPALDPNAGVDGAGAFTDGSEQFVSGDFAEDMDEDFFGFKELGLDKEFGLATLSVPLHLLQNRMHNAYQSQNTGAIATTGNVMELSTPLEPVNAQNIQSEIGLIQDYFLQKLQASNEEALIEDEDLPVKQRFPKPRLPPTGKITSPRKRPIREQQQLAKKKRKLEEAAAGGDGPNSAEKSVSKPLEKKLRLEMPSQKENAAEPEKDDGSVTGMMSPPDSM